MLNAVCVRWLTCVAQAGLSKAPLLARCAKRGQPRSLPGANGHLHPAAAGLPLSAGIAHPHGLG